MVVLGFEPGAEPPAARLQRVFGIDAATASALLARLPAAVQRNVVLVRGEYFRRALQAIGARVVLRGPRGELIAPALPVVQAAASTVPAPRASVRAAAPTAPHPAPSPVARPMFSGNGSGEQPESAFDPMSATLAQHGGHRPADLRAAQPPARASAAPTLGRASVPPPPLRVGAPTLREAVPAAARGSAAPAAPAHATALELPLRAAPTALGAGALRSPAAAVPLPRPAPPALELPSLELPSLEPPAAVAPAAAAPFAPIAPAAPLAPAAPFAPFAASAPLAWGASAAAPPAMWAAGLPESALQISRDPSSVFDPPPAARSAPVSLPPAAGALSLELTGSPLGLGALRCEPLAEAMLDPWEVPDSAEMAEPALPSSRPPVRARARPSQQPSRRPAARVSSPTDTVATRAGGVSAAPPVQVGVADRSGPASRPVVAHDPRSFWQSIGAAFALPFSGSGPYWIFAIGAWSVAVGVLGFLSSFLFVIGLIVMFLAHTSLIAFACDFYRVCLWQPVVGEDAIDIPPSFDAQLLLERYLRSGMHLSLFAIASQIPVIAWLTMSLLDGEPLFAVLGNPLTWMLFVFPYVYWPMGVGIAALANDSSSIWNVIAGLRAIIRAPLEYMTIVIIGLGVLVVSWALLALCGSLLGAAGAVLSGTVGLPLALSHGLQGALMGHLARTRSEIFE